MPTEPDTDARATAADHSLAGRRLLVADDDAGLRGGVVELLASLELEILEAESGPAALEILRHAQIHAALLDLHMPGDALPGLGGLEVLAALHARSAGGAPRTPCILYSADLTPALESRARTAGALAVLHKPVDPTLLRSEVMRAIADRGLSA